ncbi:MAG TPA: ABC transporter ATP-binding protein [Candidatus Eisenbergiella merdavium]|uniref:ABC-type quaternary amine transporter n=1 Tax=Candidatus Eisenbergiella merdavium TaxID=2838551 RepID=A0A9D2SRP7_9FIRM|nr:ABC transporter ATP-binding protein [Candidatus Eisenbergiella merdavium]
MSSVKKKIKLEIKNMKKTYPNGDGVENINIQVHEGEFVTMLGPSGCGKSTILRTLGGFLKIDGGEILLDEQEIQDLPPEKRPTAMVFQSYNLWPHMTVYENLMFGLKLRRVPKNVMKKEADEALKLVGMDGYGKKYPNQLSGGQQQRVAIARALLLKPSVLLLDEPFSALDAKIRQQMREELKRIQEELNITVVFVTHDQEEAMALSHRIVVMNKGVIEQIGTPEEIYDNPATKYVASFIGEMNFIEENNGRTLAVRPEDIVLTRGESGDMVGSVRSIMMLGHYAEIIVQMGNQTVKSYLNRALAGGFRVQDRVSLSFNRVCEYSA